MSIPQNYPVVEVPAPQKTNGNKTSDPIPKKYPFQTLSLAETAKRPMQQWLLKGILQTKTVSMVYGDSNAGKTFLVFDWALRISKGLPWLERETRQGSVLYIAAEGVDGMKARIEAWLSQNQMDVTDFPDFSFIGEVVHLVKDKSRIMDTIEAMPTPPSFIVIDTLSMCTLGLNENSDDMAEAIKTAHDLKQLYNTHVCIVHHAGKSGDYRGHSSLRGNIDTQILLTGDDSDFMTITCMKQRDGAAKFEPITCKREVIDLGYTDDMGMPVTSCVIIAATAQGSIAVTSKKLTQALEALQLIESAPASQWARTLAEMYGIKERTFYSVLKQLLREELVIRDGEPRKGALFRLTEAGKTLLQESEEKDDIAATATITANSDRSEDTFTASLQPLQQPFRVAVIAVKSGSEDGGTSTEQETEATPGVKNPKLYGPPLRACFKCRTENWYYVEDIKNWKCGTCEPPQRQEEQRPEGLV